MHQIETEFTFAAAHRLPRYQGKCFNLHGHNYRFQVVLRGEPDPYSGILVDFGEVEKGEGAKIREGELELAEKLIAELTHDEFKPEQYKDEYRQRVLDLVNTKVEGKEITTAAAPADVFGLTWWFVLTGRRDLAPPPER